MLKPAAETPYSALALAELGERAGLPAGVFNVITTDAHVAAVGKELCENKLVKKISFTGSTGVGKLLMQQSSCSLKKLSLELGGNAPFIGTAPYISLKLLRAPADPGTSVQRRKD